MSSKRPENSLPPELYYNEAEALKYTSNTHIIDVQTRISERAIELLSLSDDRQYTLLDIGCGSGLSGEVISEGGYNWVGVDISRDMLRVAKLRDVEGDLLLGDIGCGLPFRAGCYDGAISVSALQWLCVASNTTQDPVRRIRKFFSSLYSCLTRDARAVLQFYPESISQSDLLQSEAVRAGFTGGLLIDYPNSTRAKKIFLVLDVCPSKQAPQPIGGEFMDTSSIIQGRHDNVKRAREMKVPLKHSIAWINNKKERARKQMKEVANDSKYTGRKRPVKF